MSAIGDLARPAVRGLAPYVSARSITSVGRLLLDANEAPESGVPQRPGLNRYPAPQPEVLVSRLAELYEVSADQILVGRGSDEAIELLVRAFCEAGQDQILIAPPTYGVYAIAAAIQGAGVVRVPLRQQPRWSLDEEALVAAALDPALRIKLVFLCSPNNPTGTGFDPSVLARIAERVGDRALVIVDEAYAEWSQLQSLLPRVSALPNLVVLRTLSKAWAIAGARVGAAIASPEILSLLHRIRAPYPLSSPAIDAAVEALSPGAVLRLEERVARVRQERGRLGAALRALPIVKRVDDSEGNFLLVELADREALLAAARARGIILRDRHQEPGLADCVRITVGAPGENDELITLLESVRP